MSEQRSLPGNGVLFADQVSYQLRLLTRNPRALFSGILLPVLLLVLRETNAGPSHRVQLSLIAGLAVFGVISTAYVSHATGLVNAREAGVLRRWRASPLPAWCFFAGRIVATAALADAGAVVTLLVARLTGTSIGAQAFAEMLLPVTLGVLAWAAIGTVVTRFVASANGAYPLLAASYLPLILLSGGVGPAVRDGEPGWLSTLVSYLPAQPIVDGATRAIRDGAPVSGRDVLVLTAWLVAGSVAALRLFDWDPRPTPARAARHGEPPARGR